MKIIAHRGLLDGPNTELQNNPLQVTKALEQGFDVEIDVWFDKGVWYLGHDTMDYKVPLPWLTQERLWIHCKNISAFYNLKRLIGKINFFYHESDKIVLTSNGNVWTYFGLPETKDTMAVCVMPEVNYNWTDIEHMVKTKQWFGICTDWPRRIKEIAE